MSRIEAKHKNALIACKPELCECLSLTQVLVHLEAKGILDRVQIMEIKAHRTEHARNEAFVDTIVSKGSSAAFPTLIAALKEYGQKHVAEMIMKNVHESASQGSAASATVTASTAAFGGYHHDYERLKHEPLPVAVRNEIRKSVLHLPNNIRDPQTIIDYMQATDALNDQDVSRLQALQTQSRDRIRMIIDILHQSSVHNFVRFLEALDISGQQHAKTPFAPILEKEFQLQSTVVVFS